MSRDGQGSAVVDMPPEEVLRRVGTMLRMPPEIPAVDQLREEKNSKEKLEYILCFILGIRVAGHSSNAASSDSSISGPMMEAVYGGAGLLVFMISMLYDCVAGRAERIGKKMVFESHFSGIKLQFFISYILSLIGAVLWMTETNKPVAAQNKHLVVFAQIILGAAGFITSKNGRELARKARHYFQPASNAPASVAEATVSDVHIREPFGIEVSSEPARTPRRELRETVDRFVGRVQNVTRQQSDAMTETDAVAAVAFPVPALQGHR